MATMLDCLSMYCTENIAIMVTMAALSTKEGTIEQTKLILMCIYTKTERLAEIINSWKDDKYYGNDNVMYVYKP